MKKTLVALAALAVVGAAYAQSSVTLYGKIDVHLTNRTQKTGGVKTAGGNVGFEVNSAGLSGSRWGLKGTEDLGGGLRAIFDLQGGFNIDSGAAAQGGLLFGRQAYVGLAGGFGTVTFGRQYSPIDNLWGSYDGQGYTTNSAMGYAWNGGPANAVGVHIDVGRINNSIAYSTPNMSGFTVMGMFAPGENKNPVTGQSASKMYGLWLNYAAGPLGVALSYDRNGVTGAAGMSQSNHGWTLGASYDLGVAKLYGGYENHSSDITTIVPGTAAAVSAPGRDKGWMFGAAVPIGAMTLNVGYAREKTTTNGVAGEGKNSAIGAQLVYPLSKRTNLYADLMSGKSTPNGGLTTKNSIVGVGMRHDF